MKKKINENGFSLVELLGVMVILGILISSSVIAYSRYRKTARIQAYDTIASSAADAAAQQYLENIKNLSDRQEDICREVQAKAEEKVIKIIREAGGKLLAAATYSENSQNNKSFAYDNRYGMNAVDVILTNINEADDVANFLNNKDKIVTSIVSGICSYLNIK